MARLDKRDGAGFSNVANDAASAAHYRSAHS
jgi:hypothetical protein